MFNFLKKTNSQRNMNPSYPYPMYPQNPYFPQQIQPSNYDMNIFMTEIDELKRQINDLTKKVIRLENYIGIRQEQDF